jgi:hypothetical protein
MNEFDIYPTIGAESLLMNKLFKQSSNYAPNDSFDPYQALLKRKKQGEDTKQLPIQEYDPNDLYELEQFCRKHNIIGFNTGKMNPKFALQFLKQKMGIKTETPTVESKKQILSG